MLKLFGCLVLIPMLTSVVVMLIMPRAELQAYGSLFVCVLCLCACGAEHRLAVYTAVDFI